MLALRIWKRIEKEYGDVDEGKAEEGQGWEKRARRLTEGGKEKEQEGKDKGKGKQRDLDRDEENLDPDIGGFMLGEGGGFIVNREENEEKEEEWKQTMQPISLRSLTNSSGEPQGGRFLRGGACAGGGGFIPGNIQDSHSGAGANTDGDGGFIPESPDQYREAKCKRKPIEEDDNDADADADADDADDADDDDEKESLLSEDPDMDNEDLDWF